MGAERAFRVRRAGREDVEDFVRLRMQLFDESARPEPPFDRAALLERTHAASLRGLEARTLLVWLARSDAGEALGACALHLFPRLPSPASPTGEEGYVVHVHTVSGWRRRGVGSALLEAMLAEARALGLGRLRLHTTAEGRLLYARFGFGEHTDNMQLVL